MTPRVVMLAGRGASTALVYNRLQREVGVTKAIVEAPVPTSQLVRRRIKKLGLPTVASQVLFKLAVSGPLERSSRRRMADICHEFDLDDTPIPHEKLETVDSVNSPSTLETLLELAPTVVVVNGTRIISRSVLERVSAPFINMHAGITPLYRGVHGGYWALAKGDRDHCGVTVHLVDPGIDTGQILGQAAIAPTSEDSFATYPLLQVAAGLPLLVEAVRATMSGTLNPRPAPAGKSQLWSHPTLGQYLKARLLRGVR